MSFDFQRARPLLQTGNLAQLFVEELGWEPCRQKLTLRADGTDHAFTAVAEKRSFTAWLCLSADSRLPDHTTRLKLDRALAQSSFEHLIVFATADLGRQSWLWVRREPGRPLSARTHDFNRGQPGDSLLAKLQILYVSLEEEEAGLTITQIAGRAQAAFDIERVTKAYGPDSAAFLDLLAQQVLTGGRHLDLILWVQDQQHFISQGKKRNADIFYQALDHRLAREGIIAPPAKTAAKLHFLRDEPKLWNKLGLLVRSGKERYFHERHGLIFDWRRIISILENPA